jgi:tetratricopeptide (TPR) repeat protein
MYTAKRALNHLVVLAIVFLPQASSTSETKNGVSLRDQSYDIKAGCAEDLNRQALDLQSRGLTLYNKRDPKAIALLKQAISIEPRLLPARSNLGLFYAYTDSLDKAVSVLKEGLVYCVDDPNLYSTLGDVYSIAGQTQNAIVNFRKAIQFGFTPKSVPYYNTGNQFGKQGNVDSAIVYYEKALEIDPLYTKALQNLIVSHVNEGNKKQALKRIEQLEKLDTEDEMKDWIREGKKRLNNLR